MSLFVNAQKFPPNFELVKKSYSDRFLPVSVAKVREGEFFFILRIANSNFIHSTALMQFFFRLLITREILLRAFYKSVYFAFKPRDILKSKAREKKFETLGCNSQNEDFSPSLSFI